MNENIRTSTLAGSRAPARETRGLRAEGGAPAGVLPGVLLAAAIAAFAFLLRRVPGIGIFSPMIISTFLGMALHNGVGTPAWAKAGVVFSLKRILRLGIMLLGFQLLLTQVVQIGLTGISIILITLAATFAFTKSLGRVMGVDRRLAELIAAGTSICGASAVIATNTVTEGSDEDVAYAVACVTVFGSVAMFLYPLLPAVLGLDPHSFGLWSGSSIHEIAQVVAAAFQDGDRAGETATIAKLTRVIMLAPLVLTLGFLAARRARHTKDGKPRTAPPKPWFVAGFIAMMLINAAVTIPPAAKAWIVAATTFFLSMALAAMGLETDFRKLKAAGLKPVGLAAAAWAFIAGFSLVLVKLFA